MFYRVVTTNTFQRLGSSLCRVHTDSLCHSSFITCQISKNLKTKTREWTFLWKTHTHICHYTLVGIFLINLRNNILYLKITFVIKSFPGTQMQYTYWQSNWLYEFIQLENSLVADWHMLWKKVVDINHLVKQKDVL